MMIDINDVDEFNMTMKQAEKSGDWGTKHAAGREDREKSSPVPVCLIPTSRSCRHMARG